MSGEKCPACTDENAQADKESWIRCDTCKIWFHWGCVSHSVTPDPSIETGESGADVLETIDKWHCGTCLAAHPTKKITFKHLQPTRKSTRRSTRNQASTDTDGGGAGASGSGGNGGAGGSTSSNGAAASDSTSKPPETNKWVKMLSTKPIVPDTFKRMSGADVHRAWAESDPTAFTEPVVVPAESIEGLGLKMPEYTDTSFPPEQHTFTVSDVARIMGPETPVQVIDVVSQSSSPGWTLGRWASYFHTPVEKRKKVLNVISLEISDCKELAGMIEPPRVVRECDWVERFWPRTPPAPVKKAAKGKGKAAAAPGPGEKEAPYPKVQLYCLMGVARAWTDWHVDFAGSSVYYHIYRGRKTFYFIRPTPHNLAAYTKWSSTPIQSTTWLGDLCAQPPKPAVNGHDPQENDANVYRVELKAGDTMIIPAGWIHAVYTPEDTLVFGGNFLQGLGCAMQLKVRQIEIATKVPRTFRFPHFSRLCWHVASSYVARLRAEQSLSHLHPTDKTKPKDISPPPTYPRPADDTLHPRLLRSLLAVADFLLEESRLVESSARITSRASSHPPGDHPPSGSSTRANGTPNPDHHGGGKGEKETPAMKEAKEAVPFSYVEDPSSLAREFRWRLKLAIDGDEGGSSDAEEEYDVVGTKRKVLPASAKAGQGQGKRVKIENEPTPSPTTRQVEVKVFRNFRPKRWDYVHESGSATGQEELGMESKASGSDVILRRAVPKQVTIPPAPSEGTSAVNGNGTSSSPSWEIWNSLLDGTDPLLANGSSAPMDVDISGPSTSSSQHSANRVHRHTETLVKLRRTEKGFERQIVERVLENWTLVEDEGEVDVPYVPVAVPDTPGEATVANEDLTMVDVAQGQIEVEPGEADVVMDLPLPPLPQEVEGGSVPEVEGGGVPEIEGGSVANAAADVGTGMDEGARMITVDEHQTPVVDVAS